jgi:hypothetical protein
MFIPRLQLKGILRNNRNITFVTHKFDENLMEEQTCEQGILNLLIFWLILCVNQLSIAAGGGAGGVCLFKVRGDKALTTMLMLGRNSASYCTHKAATAASCI